jgi:predicted MFS family arabinose efflux permease
MATLTVATVLSAVAPGFVALLAARALAGLGVACLTPAVFAAVGDLFSYEERGRAMSWVISANTSASIFGVPAGAVVSGVLSWRWTFVALAGLLVVFTWLLFRRLPPDAPRRAGEPGNGMGAVPRVLRDWPTTAALLSNYLSTSYWFVFATYMGAYFHDEFGVAKWALGGLTMTMGLGVLLGSNAGGRISDRVGKRPVILWTSLACAIFISLTTTAAVAMAAGLAFLFLFAVSGGARFASSQAIMTEMSPEYRGTVMALNAAGQQFGIVTGSLVGGLALEAGGYTALGPTAAALALVSMAMYGLFVQEQGRAAGRRELVTE